jgi:hypothetical protein
VLYLSQADYDVEVATIAYKDDERWELDNPLRGNDKDRRAGIKRGNMMTSPVQW